MIKGGIDWPLENRFWRVGTVCSLWLEILRAELYHGSRYPVVLKEEQCT